MIPVGDTWMWMTRRSDAFNTVFEVLTLEIPLLVVQALWSSFWRSPSHTCIPAVQTHFLLLSVFTEWGLGGGVRCRQGERVGRKHPFLFVAQRGEVWTGKCPTNPESGDASQSLYLCNIFAVWSLIRQLCSSLKASGFHFSFVSTPFALSFHSLFPYPSPPPSLSQGSSLSSKTEKEPRFMLEEIKVNDHWLIFIFCGCGWRSNQCRWPCQLGVFLCHQENKESAGIELPQLFQD